MEGKQWRTELNISWAGYLKKMSENPTALLFSSMFVQFTASVDPLQKENKQSISWETYTLPDKPIFTTDGIVEDLLENNRN